MITLSVLTVFSLGYSPVASAEAVQATPKQYDCAEAKWTHDPSLEDGIFISSLGADCTIEKSPEAKPTITNLVTYIRELIQTTRTVHDAPTEEVVNGMQSLKFDTTSIVKDDGSPIEIREVVTLSWNAQGLTYSTTSKDVKASGMAGYLKKVDFLAEVRAAAEIGKFKVRMTNAVTVERPWYAFAPIFFAIAKGVARDKFDIARDKILPDLVSHL